MRTNCIRCDKVREINKELVETKIIFSEEPSSPNDYLKLFNVTSGKCIDEDGHQFVYNLEDNRQLNSTIKTIDEHEGQKQAKELEEQKVKETIIQLKQQLEKFEKRDSELPKEKEDVQKELDNDLQKLEVLTGSRNLKLWGEKVVVRV